MKLPLQKYRTFTWQKVYVKQKRKIADSLKTVLQTVSACNVPPPANTCRACTDSLGTLATYKSRFLSSIGNPSPVPQVIVLEMEASYKKAQLHCEQLCNTTSRLIPTKRALMLADMIPFQRAIRQGYGHPVHVPANLTSLLKAILPNGLLVKVPATATQ